MTCLISVLNDSVYPCDYNKDKFFRGFMIDAPRGVESMEYYFRLIDFCQKEEFNSIIFRLTDDQGSAYFFTSHPELKMCEGALTADELGKLVAYSQSRGIELIPEIESFGHSKYITQTEEYKFLNDGPVGAEFNALSPVNDATIGLMKDLYTEIASIFPGGYIHIGCDEVNWGASEMSKNALKARSKPRIWAEYVNKLNECVKSLGKKAIIWGDVPIYHEKDVLDLLNRDILLKNKYLSDNFRKLARLIAPYRESVTRNKGDFDDFLSTLNFIEYNYNRQNELLEFVHSKRRDLKSVETYLKKVAMEDQEQLSTIWSAWCQGRRCNPNEVVNDCMWSFGVASGYSKHLSENPSKFIKILRK
ncbi:MAG: family 20 glycosylhydrolase [Prolixibacteraceae bacterium]|nr:family 20 glycosylhydrolase [Prolixibacteraceae bacterium]